MLLHLGPFHCRFGPRKSDLQTLTATTRTVSETYAEGVEARRKQGLSQLVRLEVGAADDLVDTLT